MTPWSKFGDIKAALDAEDIEGLLALDCPANEYDGEASLIESQMAHATEFGQKKITAKQIEEIVARVWNDQFGPFNEEALKRRRPAFSSVAGRLTEL